MATVHDSTQFGGEHTISPAGNILIYDIQTDSLEIDIFPPFNKQN